MNPLIRIRLAQLLARRYNLTSEQAVDVAEDLVKLLAAGNLDIVLSTWVNDVGKEPKSKEGFWDELSAAVERADTDFPYHPWNP